MGAAFDVYNNVALINYLRIAQHPVGYLINFGYKGTLSGNALSCLSSLQNKVVKISVD